MLGQLAHKEIVFAIVAVIAIVVAMGIAALIIKTKKPAELPPSMRPEEHHGHRNR